MLDMERILARQPDAIVREFATIDEWLELTRSIDVFDRNRMRAIAERAAKEGVTGLHLGFDPAPQIVDYGDGLHWGIDSAGLDCRSRAVLDLIEGSKFGGGKHTRIYGGEAFSAVALALRGRYAQYLGSQYIPDPAQRVHLYPVEHQDLQALTLPSNSFDIVVTLEVLEHIPDLPAALAEQARVLRAGGFMLATFPFAWNSRKNIQKAVLQDGEIKHLVDEPEYHGNPMTNEGILVFQVPGWELIETAKAAGFSRAGYIFYSTGVGGIIGHDLIGQFVFIAYK